MKRFHKFAGGVIQDAKTNLEWLPGPDQDITWPDAKKWADKQKVDGGNWRLPTLEELKSLHVKDKDKKNLPKDFELTAFYVWSGEMKDIHTAWAYFYPLDGEDWSTKAASFNFRVLAVRGNGIGK